MNHPTASAFSTAHAGDLTNAFANPLIGELVANYSGSNSVSLNWGDIVPHRDYLVRFAQRKLQDPALAEDVVHDVFEAVISGRASFEGRSALRSWLTAILKNKIVDVIRQRARFAGFGSFDFYDADADADSADDAMMQLECPNARPDEVAEQRELLLQTLNRISSLPAGLRDVMQFRVLQDESSEAVCERLHISESSLFVRLHRARRQLLC
jgi:RNA polymerase sigma-70 factor (ECF subfamily)